MSRIIILLGFATLAIAVVTFAAAMYFSKREQRLREEREREHEREKRMDEQLFGVDTDDEIDRELNDENN